MSGGDKNESESQTPIGPAGTGLRVVTFAVLWTMLTGGRLLDSWYIGLPAVVLATFASHRLATVSVPHIRIAGVFRFVPFFVHRSLVGGVDVALRAFRPSMPLSPDLVRYRMRLPEHGGASVFFAAVISLLPGTLCAELHSDSVEVHVVDRTGPIEEQLAELEERVASLFGESLQVDGP